MKTENKLQKEKACDNRVKRRGFHRWEKLRMYKSSNIWDQF